MQTSTVLFTTVGLSVTGFLAYAVYFDNKRRTDPEFRRALKRSARQQARLDRDSVKDGHKEAIDAIISQIESESLPSPDESEEYFMRQLTEGERLAGLGESKSLDAAGCLFRALKVFHQPQDLMKMFDQLIPPSTLNALAELIAADPDALKRGSSEAAIDD